jgi:dethiobiotin synthetase
MSKRQSKEAREARQRFENGPSGSRQISAGKSDAGSVAEMLTRQVFTVQGLTVVGTEAGCGKTAIMAGLARALRDQGQELRAIKPLAIGPREKLERELSFLSLVTGTPRNYGAIAVGEKQPGDVYWTEALSLVRSGRLFTMVETCGSAVTPICFETGLDIDGRETAQSKQRSGQNSGSSGFHWRDSRDLALELGFPVIIVARHNQEAIEKLILTYNYLTTGGVNVCGLVTVECTPGEGAVLEARLTRSDLELLLATRIVAPYLGALKYSPSISVTRVNQGNLVKVLENGVDLLAFRRALNWPLTL